MIDSQFKIRKSQNFSNKMYLTPIGQEFQYSLQDNINLKTSEPIVQQNYNFFNQQTVQNQAYLQNLESKFSKITNPQQIYEHLDKEINSQSKYIKNLIGKASQSIMKTRQDHYESLFLPPLDLRQKLLLRDKKKSVPEYKEEINTFKQSHNSFVNPEVQYSSLNRMITKTLLEKEKIIRITMKQKQIESLRRHASTTQVQNPLENSENINMELNQESLNKIKSSLNFSDNFFEICKKQQARQNQQMKDLHKRKYLNFWEKSASNSLLRK